MTIQGYPSTGWTTSTFSSCTIGELFSINAPCLSVYSPNGSVSQFLATISPYQIAQSTLSYYNYNPATGNGISHIPAGINAAVAITITIDNTSIIVVDYATIITWCKG